MPLNVGWEKVANMTRETKLGLVVSCSFLCLLGVVLVLKLTENPAETSVAQVPADPAGAEPGAEEQKLEAKNKAVAAASNPASSATTGNENKKPETSASGSGESLVNGGSGGGPAITGEPGKLDEALVRADWTTQTEETGKRWWHPPLPRNSPGKPESTPLVATPPGKNQEPLGPASPTFGLTGGGLPPVAPLPLSGSDKETGSSLALGGSPPLPDKTTDRSKEDKTSPPAPLTNSHGSPKEVPLLEPGGKPGENQPSGPSDPKLTNLAKEKKEGEKDSRGPLAGLPPLAGTEKEKPVPSPGPRPGELVSPPAVPEPLMPPVKETTSTNPLADPVPVPGNFSKPPNTQEPNPGPGKPAGTSPLVSDPAASTGTGTKPSEPIPPPLVGENRVPKEAGPLANLGIPNGGFKEKEETARPSPGSSTGPLSPSPRLTPTPVDTPLEGGSRPPAPTPSPSPGAVPALNGSAPSGLSNSVRLMEPKVISFSEEIYSCSPGDNFSTISKQKYGTDKYAQALLLFNRNHLLAGDELSGDASELKPQQKIYLPPADVLENRYPASIKEPSPAAGKDSRTPPPSPPSGAGETRTEGTPAAVAPSPGPSPATRSYRVQGNGETMRQIAGHLLRNPDRWNEIYELNPGWRPEFLVPGGTVLNVPALTADSR